MTAILDALYTVIVLLVWAAVAFTVISGWLRIGAARLPGETVPALMWRHRGRLLFLAVLVVVTTMITGVETAYRPKVSVSPANPVLDERLKKLDEVKPEVKPAAPDRPTWEEQQQKNREESEKAREEFKKLPPK